MLRTTLCLLLALATSGCTIVAMPPEPLAGDTGPRIDPCASATKENLTAECLEPNPEAERLVGRTCELHPAFFLQRDTVRFAGGYAASPLAAERPGSYVHSSLAVGTGCVTGKPFTEVAYCAECRRVRGEWERGDR